LVPRILAVEDETSLAKTLRFNLERALSLSRKEFALLQTLAERAIYAAQGELEDLNQ